MGAWPPSSFPAASSVFLRVGFVWFWLVWVLLCSPGLVRARLGLLGLVWYGFGWARLMLACFYLMPLVEMEGALWDEFREFSLPARRQIDLREQHIRQSFVLFCLVAEYLGHLALL